MLLASITGNNLFGQLAQALWRKRMQGLDERALCRPHLQCQSVEQDTHLVCQVDIRQQSLGVKRWHAVFQCQLEGVCSGLPTRRTTLKSRLLGTDQLGHEIKKLAQRLVALGEFLQAPRAARKMVHTGQAHLDRLQNTGRGIAVGVAHDGSSPAGSGWRVVMLRYLRSFSISSSYHRL